MSLGQELAGKLAEATLRKTAAIGVRNAEANRKHIHRTIGDLSGPGEELPDDGTAMVVCAGPSLHHRKSVPRLRDLKYRGAIVAVDGSLAHCLRAGIVPHYVITLDPHPDRIIRWFGDPKLEERAPDDYFRRQDLDPAFAENEIQKNRELIALVDRHAPSIKLITATCIDPGLTERCVQAGFPLYWWNPLYDDTDEADSVSRALFEANGVPCMVTGGNCGSAAWVFSHAVLGRKNVGLLGMDLGYRPGTPLLNTQYYYPMKELLGDRVAEGYIPVRNPFLGEDWFTDPTYWWYRSCFLSMVGDAECATYNCSEGGTLFGEGVSFVTLDEFIARFGGA
jgi:hypothetical protein